MGKAELLFEREEEKRVIFFVLLALIAIGLSAFIYYRYCILPEKHRTAADKAKVLEALEKIEKIDSATIKLQMQLDKLDDKLEKK